LRRLSSKWAAQNATECGRGPARGRRPRPPGCGCHPAGSSAPRAGSSGARGPGTRSRARRRHRRKTGAAAPGGRTPGWPSRWSHRIFPGYATNLPTSLSCIASIDQRRLAVETCCGVRYGAPQAVGGRLPRETFRGRSGHHRTVASGRSRSFAVTRAHARARPPCLPPPPAPPRRAGGRGEEGGDGQGRAHAMRGVSSAAHKARFGVPGTDGTLLLSRKPVLHVACPSLACAHGAARPVRRTGGGPPHARWVSSNSRETAGGTPHHHQSPAHQTCIVPLPPHPRGKKRETPHALRTGM
jgi:hypothetical protein